ncbi:hypothetical protein AAC387_Pa02g3201 [Persea americana]
MAESAVDFLLQTLGSLVRQEASLLRGLRGNSNDIQHELQSMEVDPLRGGATILFRRACAPS